MLRGRGSGGNLKRINVAEGTSPMHLPRSLRCRAAQAQLFIRFCRGEAMDEEGAPAPSLPTCALRIRVT